MEGRIDVTIALKENNTDTADTLVPEETGTGSEEGEEAMQIKITVGDTELYAALEDNAATRALMEQMPMTLSMSDLYSRGNVLPGTEQMPFRQTPCVPMGMRSEDIAYWPPRGSLVILYAQNGEQFERQHLGHIDSGVEVFESTGDADVTFEVVDD